MPTKAREEILLESFLSSAFFAEDDAAPVVSRLLERTPDPEEHAALTVYAADEARHAELLGALLRRKGVAPGEPFVIQRFFHVLRSRAAVLAQTYHVELMAGVFYGAVAQATRDPDTRSVLRRILLDEARHIRLHRELYRREIARQRGLGRIRARILASLLRRTVRFTAWLQARQLAPLLGERARYLPDRIDRRIVADSKGIFRDRPSSSATEIPTREDPPALERNHPSPRSRRHEAHRSRLPVEAGP
jgi:rubrerythrin